MSIVEIPGGSRKYSGSTRDSNTAIVPKPSSSQLWGHGRRSDSGAHEAIRCSRQILVVGASKPMRPSRSWMSNTLIKQALPGSNLCWCLCLGTFSNLSVRCLYHSVAADSVASHKYGSRLVVVPMRCPQIAPV